MSYRSEELNSSDTESSFQVHSEGSELSCTNSSYNNDVSASRLPGHSLTNTTIGTTGKITPRLGVSCGSFRHFWQYFCILWETKVELVVSSGALLLLCAIMMGILIWIASWGFDKQVFYCRREYPSVQRLGFEKPEFELPNSSIISPNETEIVEKVRLYMLTLDKVWHEYINSKIEWRTKDVYIGSWRCPKMRDRCFEWITWIDLVESDETIVERYKAICTSLFFVDGMTHEDTDSDAYRDCFREDVVAMSRDTCQEKLFHYDQTNSDLYLIAQLTTNGGSLGGQSYSRSQLIGEYLTPDSEELIKCSPYRLAGDLYVDIISGEQSSFEVSPFPCCEHNSSAILHPCGVLPTNIFSDIIDSVRACPPSISITSDKSWCCRDLSICLKPGELPDCCNPTLLPPERCIKEMNNEKDQDENETCDLMTYLDDVGLDKSNEATSEYISHAQNNFKNPSVDPDILTVEWLPDFLGKEKMESSRFIQWMISGGVLSQAGIPIGKLNFPDKVDPNSYQIVVQNRYSVKCTDGKKMLIIGRSFVYQHYQLYYVIVIFLISTTIINVLYLFVKFILQFIGGAPWHVDLVDLFQRIQPVGTENDEKKQIMVKNCSRKESAGDSTISDESWMSSDDGVNSKQKTISRLSRVLKLYAKNNPAKQVRTGIKNVLVQKGIISMSSNDEVDESFEDEDHHLNMPAYSLEGERTDEERMTHRKGAYKNYFERRASSSTEIKLLSSGSDRVITSSFTKKRKLPEPRSDSTEQGFQTFQHKRSGSTPEQSHHLITSQYGEHLIRKRTESSIYGDASYYYRRSEGTTFDEESSSELKIRSRAGVSRGPRSALDIFSSSVDSSYQSSRPSIRITSPWSAATPRHLPNKSYRSFTSSLMGSGVIKIEGDNEEQLDVIQQDQQSSSSSDS